MTTVGATVGFGQGELAGDRQNLHAVIKASGATTAAAAWPPPPRHHPPPRNRRPSPFFPHQVLGPTMYGSLFAYGCRHNLPALPFIFSASVGLGAWLLAAALPATVWEDEGGRRKEKQK